MGSAPDQVNDQVKTTENTPIQTELEFEWDKFEGAIFGKKLFKKLEIENILRIGRKMLLK